MPDIEVISHVHVAVEIAWKIFAVWEPCGLERKQ